MLHWMASGIFLFVISWNHLGPVLQSCFLSENCLWVSFIIYFSKQAINGNILRCRYGGGELCSYLIVALQIGEIFWKL